MEYAEDGSGKLVYPFVSWQDSPLVAAWGLRDCLLEQVLWENALLFEAWQGGLSHTEAMSLSPAERDRYIEIAKYMAKVKKNQTSAPPSDDV